MYVATWINRLSQLGSTDITLILQDDEEILPAQRIDKSFPTELVTDEFLGSVAAAEIERVVSELPP